MTPQEKLAEIKKDVELYKKKHTYDFTEEQTNVDWLIKRVEQLEKALEFYGDNKNWSSALCRDGGVVEALLDISSKYQFGGDRAREALAAINEVLK